MNKRGKGNTKELLYLERKVWWKDGERGDKENEMEKESE